MKEVTKETLEVGWTHSSVNKHRIGRMTRSVMYVSKIAKIYETFAPGTILTIEVTKDGEKLETTSGDLRTAKHVIRRYKDKILDIKLTRSTRTLKISVLS